MRKRERGRKSRELKEQKKRNIITKKIKRTRFYLLFLAAGRPVALLAEAGAAAAAAARPFFGCFAAEGSKRKAN